MCAHDEVVMERIGGPSLVGGDFDDNSEDILVCVKCGETIQEEQMSELDYEKWLACVKMSAEEMWGIELDPAWNYDYQSLWKAGGTIAEAVNGLARIVDATKKDKDLNALLVEGNVRLQLERIMEKEAEDRRIAEINKWKSEELDMYKPLIPEALWDYCEVTHKDYINISVPGFQKISVLLSDNPFKILRVYIFDSYNELIWEERHKDGVVDLVKLFARAKI